MMRYCPKLRYFFVIWKFKNQWHLAEFARFLLEAVEFFFTHVYAAVLTFPFFAGTRTHLHIIFICLCWHTVRRLALSHCTIGNTYAQQSLAVTLSRETKIIISIQRNLYSFKITLERIVFLFILRRLYLLKTRVRCEKCVFAKIRRTNIWKLWKHLDVATLKNNQPEKNLLIWPQRDYLNKKWFCVANMELEKVRFSDDIQMIHL